MCSKVAVMLRRAGMRYAGFILQELNRSRPGRDKLEGAAMFAFGR